MPEKEKRSQADIALEIRLNQAENDADSRAAYDTIYSRDETDIALPASFYLWLMELLQLHPGERYLDVSCGHGQLTALARERGVPAFGLDLSLRGLRLGQQEHGIRHLIAGNSQQLPFGDNTFAVLSNIGSLEHYTDMKTAVAEMARVLQPGGRAYVLVPNTFSLLHNIWIAFRQGRTNIDSQPIQRYLARQEWQQLLETADLTVEKTLKYEIERPRTWPDLLTTLRHPKRLVRLLTAPLVPLNLAFCFVFICRKK